MNCNVEEDSLFHRNVFFMRFVSDMKFICKIHSLCVLRTVCAHLVPLTSEKCTQCVMLESNHSRTLHVRLLLSMSLGYTK